MIVLIANPSIGDALAYTFPIALGLSKGHKIEVYSINPDVTKLFEHVPFIKLTNSCVGKTIVFTGGPGWHKKSPYCPECKNSVCNRCGKNAAHHRFCLELMKQEWYGEWYGHLRPLNTYAPAQIQYRPKKIIETWSMNWIEGMDQLNLDWYQTYRTEPRIGTLLNCTSASRNRSLDLCPSNVHVLDLSKDIRSNLFVIAAAQHILTVDTSTVWLAKFLGKTSVFVITPDLLNRTDELGYPKFLRDGSKSYTEIDPVRVWHDFKVATE